MIKANGAWASWQAATRTAEISMLMDAHSKAVVSWRNRVAKTAPTPIMKAFRPKQRLKANGDSP